MLLLMVTAEMLYLYSNYAPENFLSLTQLAPCFGTGVLTLLKVPIVAIKRQKVFNLTKCLEKLYNTTLNDSKKKAVVIREVVLLKILIKYFFILNATLISVYNFSTLIFMLYNYLKKNKLEKGLPFAVTLPFSIESWMSWSIVYVFSIFCGK